MAEGETELSALLVPINEEPNGGDLVTNLQNQLKSLQNRVKELELENTKLASQLSSCRCRKSSVGLSHANGLVSRGPSFAPEEDIALSRSWLDGSQDPVLGMAPKKDTLWECITDCYVSHKPNRFPLRTTKSLQCRWNAISTAIKKMQGCVRQIELTDTSGLSELDVMTKAKILYGQTESGKKGFIYDHVWLILKDVEKWDYNPYKQNYETSHPQSSLLEIATYSSMGTPSSSDMNLDDEDLSVSQTPTNSSNQPTGRDQEKPKRKKTSHSAPLVNNLVFQSPDVSEAKKDLEVKQSECLDTLDNDCDKKLTVMMKQSECLDTLDNDCDKKLTVMMKQSECLDTLDNDCDKKLTVMMLQADNERRRLEYEKYDKDIKIMEKDVHLMTDPVQRSFFTNLQAKIQEKWAHDCQ